MGGANPERGIGPSARPLLKYEIETAQSFTKSNAEAARYLRVNYQTYRKYAKLYDLFESHMNRTGLGVSRKKRKGMYGLDEILNGKHPNYDRTKLKERLIQAGYLAEECARCEFKEKRILDGRCPLLLQYKDGNHKNVVRDNLELRCYNCTYLTTGRVSAKRLLNQGVHDQDLLDTGKISMDDITSIQDELMGE